MTEALDRPQAIARFVGRGERYYIEQFERIGQSRTWRPSFNAGAFLGGPIWLGARRLWLAFWPFFIAELLAFIIIAVALGGGLNADGRARVERLEILSTTRASEAEAAKLADPNAAITLSLVQSAQSLSKALEQARTDAASQGDGTPLVLGIGIAALLAVRFALAVLANGLLERKFRLWRLADAEGHAARGISRNGALTAIVLALLIVPITLWKFAGFEAGSLAAVPVDPAWNTAAALFLDGALNGISRFVAPAAQGVTAGLNALLVLLEQCLVQAPWPVVMVIILALAWQIAGRRVFVLTAVAIAYLALLGFWAKSMETVALLGTAALISIAIGIPLGVLCGYNRHVRNLARPVLDFMQTMPAFVYLIPVIALFGIGKPSGIIATIIFGIPPVVRLTALGIEAVPPSVREAATAFGASRLFLLRKVDLPIAMPSIMTGVSQSILMCLSMVVIAALIGAKGLGEDVLKSLQYAAQGQGLLAGLAILACAIVLDRIVQGRSVRN